MYSLVHCYNKGRAKVDGGGYKMLIKERFYQKHYLTSALSTRKINCAKEVLAPSFPIKRLLPKLRNT
jgi:hypothetical protein